MTVTGMKVLDLHPYTPWTLEIRQIAIVKNMIIDGFIFIFIFDCVFVIEMHSHMISM